MHAAFAGWLEQHGGSLVEANEIIGWHLEQALGYRRELGLSADASIADRAAGHLLAAGERAASRGDYPAAVNLLQRAHALLPAGHERRGRVALALADALLAQGRFDEAEAFVDEAEAEAGSEAETVLVRHRWFMNARPQEATAYSERALAPAIAHFERLGDDRLLARAHLARANVYSLIGRFGPQADEALAAADHARRAGDRGLLTQALVFAGVSLLLGPSDRETTELRLSELDSADAGPLYEPWEMVQRAILATRATNFGEARALWRESLALLDQFGLVVDRYALSQEASRLELVTGQPAEAVALLQRARDELEKLGERAFRSTCTARLSDALYAVGRSDEAERMARAAESESADVDLVNFAVAHGVRARIAADRGDAGNAERLSESAVEYAFRMDMPVIRADALRARAHVLRTIGRDAEAVAVLDEALALYERKGDLAEAARTRRLFAGAFGGN